MFKVLMASDADDRASTVLQSGHIAQGPVVDEFERRLKEVFSLESDQELLTVNSGTSALHLAMVLAGVGPGDDVCVSPMTCAATILPIIHLGARPVWIDVNPFTGLMDPESLHQRVTRKTKAIVAIDWAGTPCDYDRLRTRARDVYAKNYPIIEDAAHAMFALDRDGRSIGSAARSKNHFVCWSTQAIKTLTTVDGGILLAPSDDLVERARKLRWFGLDRRSTKDFRCSQDITEAGYKFHMNDVNAAIGLANLGLARDAVDKHRRNARRYNNDLADLDRVRIRLLNEGSSWLIYTLIVEDRAGFVRHMAERGIETSQVHRRNDEHPAFSEVAGKQEPLKGLDTFSSHQISVPCGWWLSDQDVSQIIEAVRWWG